MSEDAGGEIEVVRLLDSLARSPLARSHSSAEEIAAAAAETLLGVVRALLPAGSEVVSVLPVPLDSFLVVDFDDPSTISYSRVEVRSGEERSYPIASVHRTTYPGVVGEVVYLPEDGHGAPVSLGHESEHSSWDEEARRVRDLLREPPPTDPGELTNEELAELLALLPRLDEEAEHDFLSAYAFSRPNRVMSPHLSPPDHESRSVLTALRSVVVDGAPVEWALRRLRSGPAPA